MTADPMLVGEKLLGLLDDAALVSTYKPALLLALLDRVQERAGTPGSPANVVPVSELAERVAELYWPQTIAYPTTGTILRQNSGQQAKIVQRLVHYRHQVNAGQRLTLTGLQVGDAWRRLLDHVEVTLAEMPIPRLQEPYGFFLYSFDWDWAGAGVWRIGHYRRSSRQITLRPGIAEALVSLAPLLRPFITRWWTDKAATLNQHAIPDADALDRFEQFLFGRDRVSLTRLANDLLDLQYGSCFYCGRRITKTEVDHFLPWKHSADDGIDNLVAACAPCNNAKRAILPAALHVEKWQERNARWHPDLASIAATKYWPRDTERTNAISRTLYLLSPDERPTWTAGAAPLRALGPQRERLQALLQTG